MAFDWKKVVGAAAKAAQVFTPDKADTALDVVSAVIDSETAPNEDAVKALAAMADAQAKELKKLRSDVDALKKKVK